jgi:peptide chain release factor 2
MTQATELLTHLEALYRVVVQAVTAGNAAEWGQLGRNPKGDQVKWFDLAADQAVCTYLSPFDSQGRRHTSFASVFVYPVVDDDIDIDIDDKDLRVDTYRASGAGGQHVNKTSSAVRITHLPTGVVVSCQQERSQHKNRATAMKMLRAALYQREVEEREAERQVLEAEKTDIAWGNQIRSYVFQPYTMVTDHRSELKVGDVHRVMNGDPDEFIEAYLKRAGGIAS